MLKQELIREFLHEAENTRKLLKAIPDTALDWKPSEKNWTTRELAVHITRIYSWYDRVTELEEFKLDGYRYDSGDTSKAENIVALFEKNVKLAQKALESFDESNFKKTWKMTFHGNAVYPESPKLSVVRNLLFNHIYHHRGELVVYLRSTGNRVPGLYGPTAEDAR